MTRYTILILDDERHTQWTLKSLLEAEGYLTIGQDTAERVLKNIREFEVSGMVTEYRIGDCFALDVIKKLKKEFPETYIMMITDKQITEDEYEEIINAGVHDFFLKPCSTKKVLLHLKKGLMYRSLMLEKSRLEKELDQTCAVIDTSYSSRGKDVMATSPAQSVKLLDRDEYN